ncbi:MAG: glycosyltransferase family 4 protein, partial [Alphaproteobacteria bacterium]
MKTPLAVFVVSLFLSLALTPLARALALRFRVLDRPDSARRLHKKAIPRLGGLAVFLACVIALGLVFTRENLLRQNMLQLADRFLWLFLTAGVVLIVGIWDDARSLSAGWKFLGVLAPAAVICAMGFRLKSIGVPQLWVIELGWWSYPASIFWIVICAHAFNLIDGVDGLAAGVGFVISSTLFVFSALAGDWFVALITASVAGACLGFLRYNFSPATIFLGDSGSLVLGFALGAVSLLSVKRYAAVAGVAALVIFGLPIADTLVAVLRRWSRRLPISAPDRQHIHHKLLGLG